MLEHVVNEHGEKEHDKNRQKPGDEYDEDEAGQDGKGGQEWAIGIVHCRSPPLDTITLTQNGWRFKWA